MALPLNANVFPSAITMGCPLTGPNHVGDGVESVMSIDAIVQPPAPLEVHEVVEAGRPTLLPADDDPDWPSAAPPVVYPDPLGSWVPSALAVDRVELSRSSIADAVP